MLQDNTISNIVVAYHSLNDIYPEHHEIFQINQNQLINHLMTGLAIENCSE